MLWMGKNMDTEPIRVRIMSEAYDLADRGDSEGYNAVKVMCNDVLYLISEQQKRGWVGLTDEDIHELRRAGARSVSDKDFRAIEARLKEKNNG